MTKNTKRVLSLVLVVVMLMGMGKTTFASSYQEMSIENIKILFEEQTSTEWMELSELDGTYMYFHDNEEYTILINKYPLGMVEMMKKDKMLNITKTAITNELILKDFNILTYNSTNANTLEFFQNIENKLILNEIILEKDLISSTYQNDMASYSSEQEIAKQIDAELISFFGNRYTDAYRGSLNAQGYNAFLYETMTFERYKDSSWFFKAAQTIGEIAAFMPIPQSKLLLIFKFVATAAGVYVLFADTPGHTYIANVHNNKDIKVNNTYPYGAGKTERGYCYLGDRGASYASRNWITQDSDFNDNTGLMKTAIQNYIDFN